MKILIQRVLSAAVTVDGQVIDSIESGLLLLVGFGIDDDESLLPIMANKVANLRLFADEKGRFEYSVLQIRGEILAVPQFTLYADTAKGRRPAFTEAMPHDRARPLFGRFVKALQATGITNVGIGQFGASMKVQLVNDGPVTVMLEN